MLIKLNITNKATIVEQKKNEIMLDIPNENDFIVNLLSVEGHSLDEFCKNDEISSIELFQHNGFFYTKQTNEIFNKIICSYTFKDNIFYKDYFLTTENEDLYFDIKSDFSVSKNLIANCDELIKFKISNINELKLFCDSHDIFISSKRIVDDGLLLGTNFDCLLHDDLTFSTT